MRNKDILFAIFFAFNFGLIHGQYKGLDSIQEVIQHQKSYFDLVRETIHLDLNKETYLVQDEIWFKAYIIDRNTQKPFPMTANLYVSLYDVGGNEVLKELLYAESGLAHGSLKIPATLQTGNYAIVAYTAYQNNFREDERFKQEIVILNISKDEEDKMIPKPDIAEAVKSSYDIQILPEGGHLISENINVCGIKILDTHGDDVPMITNLIYDSKTNEIVSQCKVNQFGLGKFSFTPKKNQQYHMITKIGEESIQTILPKVQTSGIILNTNMHPNKEFLVINLKTNMQTLPEIRNKNLYVLIHQNQQVKTLTVKFTSDQISIPVAIPLTELSYGVNTVTVFSENMTPIAERLVFNHANTKQIESKIISSQRNQDSVKVTLKTMAKEINPASLSVSILPTETISKSMDNSIISSLYLKPYLQGAITDVTSYFGKLTSKKRNDLDLLLLTQGWSKYSWNNIFRGAPTENYSHENGITLKGSLNNITDTKTNLVITSPENELLEIMTPLDGKPIKNFILENRKLLDSSKVGFSITDKKGQTIHPNVIVNTNPLAVYKNGGIKSSRYITNAFEEKESNTRDFTKSMFSEAEKLEEVLIITNKPKRRKTYAGKGLSVRHQAYLHDDVKASLKNVEKYLFTKLFYVAEEDLTGIKKFFGRTRNGDIPYETFLNNLTVSADLVRDINLKQLEDIYIVDDELGVRPSIFLYTKENFSLNDKKTATIQIIKNGFQQTRKFYTPKYRSYGNENFKKHGVIGWSPMVSTDVNGTASFNFQNVPGEEIKMFIEGMDTQGNLVSEVKILTLSK